jgi:D-serine deaminase-like pyridoxal phosphate-dependent protein
MTLSNEAEIPSPALLLYGERIEANLQQMVAMVGDPARLRPHIKTHKLPQVVRRQAELGIVKCKCATIAEAEMAAGAGALEVLVAQQPVGPNIARLLALQRLYPAVAFTTIGDDADALRAIGVAASSAGQLIEILLDLDIGQRRTGVPIDAHAVDLYRLISTTPGLRPGGLHAYDGHLHQTDPVERAAACEAAFAPVAALRAELLAAGSPVPRLVVGGSPTFPMHARREGVECSPGTTVLWDAGYGSKQADLPFVPAAFLLTRVISKPGENRLCLDLGHKAVASEMQPPRVIFPAVPDAKHISHSEEHLVIETAEASRYAVGQALYGIPWHICPTVALHSEAWLVENNRAVERWPIVARARRLTI